MPLFSFLSYFFGSIIEKKADLLGWFGINSGVLEDLSNAEYRFTTLQYAITPVLRRRKPK
jgi:hypothetical protein